MSRFSSLILATVLITFSSSAFADVPFQRLADYGLGGQPADVNASGVIVGSLRVEDRAGPYVPVIWKTATSNPVELPSALGGYATAINSTGDIVGYEFQAAGPYGTPVLWSNGERIVLPDLGEGGYATDISESGVIVGNVIENGRYRAARWVNRQVELLPLPEFGNADALVWSFANSINSADVITGTIEAFQSGSVALRWNSDGVAIVQSSGLETKGIAIDNADGVLVNGYFNEFYLSPAIVDANGTIERLQTPEDLFVGAVYGVTMGRNGIAAGYYYASGENGPQIKAVAWPNGVFTPLEMPAGQTIAFTTAVGMNGMVFGSVSDFDSAVATPGFWQLNVERTTLRANAPSGTRGGTLQLSAVSRQNASANVGYSVAINVNGRVVGRAITDAEGVARFSYTIPKSAKSSRMSVRFVDETGATTSTMLTVKAARSNRR